MDLVPCSACRRHVKSEEQACPFCATSRSGSVARVGIAAGIALGLGLMVGACGATPLYGPPPSYDGGSVTLTDSGPAATDAGPAAPDSGADDAGLLPMYGPAPVDAGSDAALAGAYGPAPVDAG